MSAIEQKATYPKRENRTVSILIGILTWTQWILGFLLFTVPLTVFNAPFFPLSFGADPADPDAKGASISFGVAFDQGLTTAALYAEAIIALIYLALGVYAIGQTLGLLRNVQNGQPFVRDNGYRLRRIGYAGAIAQLSVYGVWLFVGIFSVAGLASFKGISMEFGPTPWIGVLMAFALATVFRDGADLKEEQDLVV